jgi:hypothetical protein
VTMFKLQPAASGMCLERGGLDLSSSL